MAEDKENPAEHSETFIKVDYFLRKEGRKESGGLVFAMVFAMAVAVWVEVLRLVMD